ncbi:MAG: NosD domain-containing protein [Candidatus Helarchaeota archaeon]
MRKFSSIVLLSIIFCLCVLFNTYTNSNEIQNSKTSEIEPKQIKISSTVNPFVIDGTTNQNWSYYEQTYNWCTGSGIYSDPYIIQDIIVDGGGTSSCIVIKNSDNYFRIENCTLFNAGASIKSEAGIYLYNVSNGIISDNNASNNCVSNSNGYLIFGIYLEKSNNIILINNLVNNNTDQYNSFGYGIYISTSINITLTNNTAMFNDKYGIRLFFTINCTLNGNNLSSNSFAGIQLFQAKNNTFFRNFISNSSEGIIIDESNNNTLKNNTLINCGVSLYGSKKSMISNDIDSSNTVNNKPIYYYKNQTNIIVPKGGGQYIFVNMNFSKILDTIIYEGFGITLCYSKSNIIRNTTIISNLNSGILLENSHNNSILNNSILHNSQNGIQLTYSDNNSIINNNISYNKYDGIYISSSNNISIINNNISINSKNGIFSSHTNKHFICNNTVSFNENDGIRLRYKNIGISLINNFCTNNKNYGIHLYEGENDSLIQNNIFNNSYGINIQWMKNSTLRNNSIFNNNYGIYLYRSYNNSLILNNILNNTDKGIWLYGVKQNNISKNLIEFNDIGLHLEQETNENIVSKNIFIYNYNFSILIEPNVLIPDRNSIFYNDFINNNEGGIQALDDGTNNKWNLSIGGNYWSDYLGFDIDGDGFGDVNYNLAGSASSNDYMPLIIPNFNTMPKIDDLENSFIFQGERHKILTWYPKDREMNYDSFWVIHNETLIKSGDWNRSLISINVTNLSELDLGVHNFTCLVNDTGGLESSTSVIVTVLVNHYPQIYKNVNDFDLLYGNTEFLLSWRVIDIDGNNYSFWIERNGEKKQSGFWNSDTNIIFTETEILSIGIYNYTCFINDSSGILNQSSIFIKIISMEEEKNDNKDNQNEDFSLLGLIIIIIGFIITIIGIAILITFLINKRVRSPKKLILKG